jgi:hypothetical protein
MSVVVVMYEPGMERVRLRTQAFIWAVTDAVKADAARFCPVDTTELVNTIESERLKSKGRVWVGTDHWAPQEYGARPHTIRPKGPPEGKQALWWPGLPHPVGAVRHPGNAPQPFMRPALYRRRYILYIRPEAG